MFGGKKLNRAESRNSKKIYALMPLRGDPIVNPKFVTFVNVNKH